MAMATSHVSHRKGSHREWSLREWQFSIMLATLLLTLIVEPIVFGLKIEPMLFDGFFSLMLLGAMYALSGSRRHRIVVILFGMLALLFTWIGHAVPVEVAPAFQITGRSLNALFLTYAVVATVRAIFARGEITLDSLAGVVSGYLLLGTAWGVFYSALFLASPEAFNFGEQFLMSTGEESSQMPVFIYYSFVTLTTVGYGDITPVTQTARTLSWAEAVSGQLYIAVLVAGIVGVIIGKRGSDSSPHSVERRD